MQISNNNILKSMSHYQHLASPVLQVIAGLSLNSLLLSPFSCSCQVLVKILSYLKQTLLANMTIKVITFSLELLVPNSDTCA